ncbi:MAG: hypothetical protein HYR64_09115 [Fimbriimonas ginsengisoli]|uniref:FtsQ-type POTRA domain-containing protein n=1 Tax=Fimbriimonas ginsengisoli TaxID=1005039 RepID=A0A931LWT0_FIMGI|nr:hypothetical protein [Fimbriimonas ginsengisoli]
MPRRRKRRRVNLAPVLALLLVANVAAGLRWSPLTAPVRVRAMGVEPFDRPRIAQLLGALEGRSCLQIDPREVETGVMAAPEVDSADFRRNLFGSASLRVAYRRPVARLEGTWNVLLAADGSLYPSRQTVGPLPLVRVPKEDLEPNLSIASRWPVAPMVELASRIPRALAGDRNVIEYTSRGGLCLNISESGRVIFGPPQGLEEKLARLETLLKENPSLPKEIKELNLTAPSRPVVKLATPGGKQ